MKQITSLFSVFFTILIFGQSVSDFAYVSVPENFSDFAKKNYGLEESLIRALKSKKYTILTESKNEWPAEALVDPCKVLRANIRDEGGFFRNKLILEFTDCKENLVFSQKGSSEIKEFEPGFQDALRQALIKVPLSNPKSDGNVLKEINTPKNEINTGKSSEKYTNGKLTLKKTTVDKSQFILIDDKTAMVFATCKATSKNDVFLVKLSSGDTTLGYLENGKIVIDIPNNNGFTKEVFSKE